MATRHILPGCCGVGGVECVDTLVRPTEIQGASSSDGDRERAALTLLDELETEQLEPRHIMDPGWPRNGADQRRVCIDRGQLHVLKR